MSRSRNTARCRAPRTPSRSRSRRWRRSIRELEADLGFPLFERRAQGVELTLKGNLFLRHARKILADVAEARRALEGDEEATAGRLAIGVTPLVAGYVLAEILAWFRRAFPAVSLDIVEDGRGYLEHLLVNGELDVGVIVAGAEKDGSALKVESVETSRYRVWLPMGHPLADRERISICDLSADPLALQCGRDRRGGRGGLPARGRPDPGRDPHPVGRGRAQPGGDGMPDLTDRPWSLEGDRIEARDLAEAIPPVEVAVAWRRGAPLPRAFRGGRGR